MSNNNTMSTIVLHDTVCVRDDGGGTWVPDELAQEIIRAAADPNAEALRMCFEEPMRGTWLS